jgi:hypothetical protein
MNPHNAKYIIVRWVALGFEGIETQVASPGVV